MKKYIGLFIVGFLFISCGSKQRIIRETHKKKRSSEEVVIKEPSNKIASKEDEFIVFNIVSTQDYIDTFDEIAKQNMRNHGIPASITLAQGILESGSGKGQLTMKTNNHFGIKCHTGWEGDRAYHDDDEKGECFRKYNHPMHSFNDHSLFLTTRSRYDFLFDLRKNDYKAWAKGLRKAGYATDKKYPEKLISIIERYDLDKYDKEVLKEKGIAVVENTATEPKVPREVLSEEIHTVAQGDTLYSISKRYGLTIDELMNINKLDSINIDIGQKLIISSK
ncbi:glucosaminidase domain-containing protein [Leptobacterium sp. I13]|uniref:glucosaminidase domain-containing protein n=1 Tax=Leptobacterium meishanense TaxID=3128904 RepID=UPI0030EC7859